MTFSPNEQAEIRRAFDAILGSLGPSRELGDLIARARVAPRVAPRRAPAPGGSMALAAAVTVVIGVGMALFLTAGDPAMPGDVGTSLGPEGSLPLVTALEPTSTSTTTSNEESRRGAAELMQCMVGTWDLDLAAYEAELQESLDSRTEEVVVSVDSGAGVLVVGSGMTFSISYSDLVIHLAYPISAGIFPTELVVNGTVESTFGLRGREFLPGPIDGATLVFLRSDLGSVTGASLPPPFSYRSLKMGSGEDSPVTIECEGVRLVVHDPAEALTGDGPAATWIRRPG